MCTNHEHRLGTCKNPAAVSGPRRVLTSAYRKTSEQEDSLWPVQSQDPQGKACVLTPG